MKDVFDIVKKFRSYKNSKPVILMGYYNMIYQYGENKFLKKCKNVGVNGLIVTDLPWPYNRSFSKKCKKNSITFVQLLSPTTSKIRMKKIVKDSHDMMYLISMLSTTGGKLNVHPKKILENYNKIKKINKSKNLVIGFGITSKKISKSIENRQNPVTNVGNMVKKLRRKLQ